MSHNTKQKLYDNFDMTCTLYFIKSHLKMEPLNESPFTYDDGDILMNVNNVE